MADTTPPTDKATLSHTQLDVIQEQVSQAYVAAERDPCLRHIGEHKKIADVANAIAQLRTSLAAANKRAEEWEKVAEVGGIACDQLRTQLAEARETLAKYADKNNWGYYDESGCLKGQGTYEDCCILSSQPARDTLARMSEASEQQSRLTQDNNKENTDE